MTETSAARRRLLATAAGLGLSFTLPGIDARAAAKRGDQRVKSLLTLWLDGGPSQLETWDPHPGSPIGGPTRAIATSIRGVKIAADYPRLAERLSRLSVVRSLVSKEGDHERASYLMKTGYRPDPTVRHPAIGAILVHESPKPRLEIPPFISLGFDPFPARGGFLGAQFDAFQFFDPGASPQNLRPLVGEQRQQRRLANLRVAAAAFEEGRGAAMARTLHEHNLKAALAMMSSEQLAAFDIAGEPQSARAAYGDSTFGRGCLTARRLIEAGVTAVHVVLGGFDTHDDNFSGHRHLATQLDPAMAALVDDLAERDLWRSTVVLCIGEFGRTPRVNRRDGRDHWPSGFSCLVGGGALAAGACIGATDPTGRRGAPDDPIDVGDFYATILHALGVDHSREVITPIGRPIKLAAGKPIPRLLADSAR